MKSGILENDQGNQNGCFMFKRDVNVVFVVELSKESIDITSIKDI